MKKALIIMVALVLSACTTKMRTGTITAVSTRNVEVTNIDLTKAPNKRNIIGRDSRYYILFFPITRNITLDRAIDSALDNGRGDLMVDAVLYSKTLFTFFFNIETLEIEGTVINTTGGL